MLLDGSGVQISKTDGFPALDFNVRKYPEGLADADPFGPISFGISIPGAAIDNSTLARIHGLTVPDKDIPQGTDFNDWVFKRTGILSRNHAGADYALAEFAILAARDALAEAGVEAIAIDEIVFGSTDPRNRSAGTAEHLKAVLGCHKGATVTYIEKACASFVFCVQAATSRLSNDGRAKNILVVCGDKNSALLNFKDVNTAVLFGDGAAATVISRKQDLGRSGTLLGISADSIVTTEDTSLHGLIFLDANTKFCMPQGTKVFLNALSAVKTSISASLTKIGLSIADVDHFFLHQANVKLVQSVARDMGIPHQKIYSNIRERGNTGAASPLLIASEAMKSGVARRGDVAVVAAVGMGMRWGAFVVVL